MFDLPMTIDRLVLVITGSLILLTLALSLVHSGSWLWLTALVGANMLQSAFTGYCPLAKLLKALGKQSGAAIE